LENRLHALEKAETIDPFDRIVTANEEMENIIRLLRQVVRTDVNILITGESGTGKEVVASAIHAASHRSENPFVKINCVAIPENLLESELFGYEKGAFTGASRQKKGKIEMAAQGTIFLDEIGDMNNFLQAKILRFLQEKEIERVGGVKAIPVDVRVVAATNRNLEEAIRENRFREDLYFRLNVVNVHLPPLRERREDIVLLSNFFIEKYCQHYKREIKTMTAEAVQFLQSLAWPGNVRQLENVIHRAVVLSSGATITPESLPEKLMQSNLQAGAQESDKIFPNESLHDYLQRMLAIFEKDAIIDVLKRVDYNRSRASEELRISRQTLYNKMEKYGIVIPD